MTGPTHRQYSVCFALLTVMFFYKIGLTEINYYAALLIILMITKEGAIFPDLDHSWQNIGSKTLPKKIINTLIHITGGRHRSWQTHSWDICIIFTSISYFLPIYLYNINKLSIVNKEVISIILLGFASGWISHLFSDMLTSEGVRIICFVNYKIRLVPRKIFSFKFNTGHEWEAFNFKFVKIINVFLGTICLIYPLIINGNINNIINNL